MNLTQTVLTDFVDRIQGLTGEVTRNLTEEQATHQCAPQANTIAWLLWHSGRVIDAQLHNIIGGPELWETWRESLGIDLPTERLGYAETGYAQDPRDAVLVTSSVEKLAGYLTAVCSQLRNHVSTVTDEELARVVDESFNPPVTMAVRLVSIVDDCLQHLGQASYLKGIIPQ